MSEQRTALLSALLIVSLLVSLAILAAIFAFIGWLFFLVSRHDLAAGLALFAIVFLITAVSLYAGIRLGLKLHRRSQQGLEECYERIPAKREREGQPPGGVGPDLEAKP